MDSKNDGIQRLQIVNRNKVREEARKEERKKDEGLECGFWFIWVASCRLLEPAIKLSAAGELSAL